MRKLFFNRQPDAASPLRRTNRAYMAYLEASNHRLMELRELLDGDEPEGTVPSDVEEWVSDGGQ